MKRRTMPRLAHCSKPQAPSLDHLVGAAEQREPDRETKRLELLALNMLSNPCDRDSRGAASFATAASIDKLRAG